MNWSVRERPPPPRLDGSRCRVPVFPRGFGVVLGASLAWAPVLADGAPAGLAWAGGSVMLGAAVAAVLRRPRHAPSRWALGVAAVVLLAWPGGLIHAGGWATRMMGLAAMDGLRVVLALHLLGVTALLAALGPPPAPRRARPLWITTGFMAGWLSPAWAILPASLVITLLLDRRRPGATHGEEGSPAGPWTVASAAGAAWASATLWLYLRGGLDPTPTGGILAASGGASGFLLGRWLAARRPGGAWSAAVVGALALLSTGALLSLAVPWLQPRLPGSLEAYPPWVVLDLALLAPPALAAFLFGLATPAARRRWEIDASLLAAVGAAIPIAVHLGSRGPLLMVIAGLVTGVGALLLASARPARLGGLLMASLVALGAWCLPAVEDRAFVSGWGTVLAGVVSPATWAAQRDEARWSTRHIGPDGTWALRTATSTPVADVDGVPLRGTGRAAEATMAAARLLALTAPQTRRLLVLGDDLGLATATLAGQRAGAVFAAIPHPALLQAWTAGDDALRVRLLSPGVQLVGTTGAWALASTRPQDGILSVTLRPWTDAGGRLPGGSFFAEVRRHLADEGAYVGLIEVSGLAPAELRALVGAFTAAFPRGAACLPPSGADHLILLGLMGPELPSWARLEARLGSARPGEDPVEGPLQVADRCVMPAARLATWAQQGPARRRWPEDRLPGGRLPATPTNLGVLEGTVGSPEETWDLGASSDLAAVLGRRFEGARHFLALLSDASRGDPSALLAEAQAMRAASDDTRALDTLIAPHIASATRHMDQARTEGPTSRAWQLAIDELVLARLIHPRAITPLRLLGLVYEARGEVRKAEHQYEQALAMSPEDTALLDGLARMASARGDDPAAERALRRATEITPQDWTAHQNLGVLLLRLGRAGEAEDTLRRAAGLAPREAAAPQAALAEVFLQQGRPAVALAQAELALRIEPSAYHWFLDGRCLLEVGDRRRAEAAFYQAILLDPGFFMARGALGLIFAERGDYHQAVEAFQGVLERDPGNEAARMNLQQAEALLAAAEQTGAPGAGSAP